MAIISDIHVTILENGIETIVRKLIENRTSSTEDVEKDSIVAAINSVKSTFPTALVNKVVIASTIDTTDVIVI